MADETMANPAAASETIELGSEPCYRLLVESIKDYAIFMLDPEGIVATWNAGAKAFKGYEASEIIGKHFSVFYPQETKEQGYPQYELKMALENGRFEDEGWRVRKDGSIFWANVVITAVYDPNQKLIGFGKVTRDLTERKRILDDLEATKNRVESLNKELETFSYSVSHDLRAPLRSIEGFTQVVLEDKSDQLDEEAKNYLTRVVNNAENMKDLINGLLELSHLSQIRVSPKAVNLSQQASEILNTFQENEPNRKVTWSIEENLFVYADPVLIHAALENLLSNAWKYTAAKDEARIDFACEGGEGKTTFRISDNGSGFNMKNADKLFGAFQRLHHSSTFPGSGIGLATVQRIVNRHGGHIWAVAEENQGASFYFTLPNRSETSYSSELE